MRISIVSFAATMLLGAAPAFAQFGPEPTTVPNTAPATPPETGGGRSGVGVGATQMLSGPLGASVAYDAGAWHLEGLVGAGDPPGPRDTSLFLGGRFWFHVHQGTSADFSVGAGLGYLRDGRTNDRDDDRDVIVIDAGAQIRAFIASNVALSASVGLSLLQGDLEGFGLGGQVLGGVGIHYYFY